MIFDKVIKSHAYFNMAYMHYLGEGTTKNITKFYEYLNSTLKTEPNLYTPIAILKAYVYFENLTFDSLLKFSGDYVLSFLENNEILVLSFSFYIIFYIYFFVSIKMQK